jgi:hypothetical protein
MITVPTVNNIMAARVTVVCLIALSLNVNLAYSLDFGKLFDGSEIPHDERKFMIDMLKLQFEEFVKDQFDDAGGKFIVKSPGLFDYLYLAHDVVQPIRGYLGHILGEEPLTREELCRQLIGAGTGFVGSVGGASAGSYVGTSVWPGWGTTIGGTVGGNIGYSYGKKFGAKVIGEICREIT